MQPRIQQRTDASSLLSLWRESIRPTKVHADRVLRSATTSLSEPATKLNLALTALVGDGEANTLLSSFSGEGGDLESLGPPLGLAQVKDGRLSGEEYMERYGHRDPHEVELSFPAPADDPNWFEKSLADFTRSRVDVNALLAKQRAEFDAAWRRFEAHFPEEYKAFRPKLEIVTAAAKNREAIRSESIRLSRLIRQSLLQAGNAIAHAAIVARETGIPAVVGCGNATMLLKSGDHICVDGGRGFVGILKP